MRIGVVGDIHGNYEGLCEAVRRMGRLDLLLFTGDGYREISRLSGESNLPIEGVAGNCDFAAAYPLEQTMGYDGCRILLTHGHKYGVKNGLTRIGLAAREKQVDLVVFGHTHQALDTDWYGVRLFNPGSLSLERASAGPSYGLIETDGDGIKTKIFKLASAPANHG